MELGARQTTKYLRLSCDLVGSENKTLLGNSATSLEDSNVRGPTRVTGRSTPGGLAMASKLFWPVSRKNRASRNRKTKSKTASLATSQYSA
jgi:hypothetical protein